MHRIRLMFLLCLALTLSACEGMPFHDDLTAQSYVSSRMYFGEASEHNLRMMVARRRDLYAPRRETPADATKRDNVISAYQNTTAAPQSNRSDSIGATP
ncbi:MAG: CpaD family pilus assembly lipoprotein [Alphaproteobacteria bacterium]